MGSIVDKAKTTMQTGMDNFNFEGALIKDLKEGKVEPVVKKKKKKNQRKGRKARSSDDESV
jgi:hypothetical protein